MTRFMLLQNYGATLACDLPMTEWDPADIKAHIDFQMALNEELTGSGELVDAQGLAGPELAKFVTFDGGRAPVVTDGPFPESKELLAGYRMIDVESEARAIEIAAKASAAPGPGGVPIQQPIEVRQVMGAPAGGASERRGRAIEDLLRELAPQVLGALVRRFGDFDAAEDAVQEALLAAALHWPADGVPGEPARLADPDRRAAADRPAAQRAGPPAPRGRRRGAAEPPAADVPDRDDTLILLFMCCHPALTPASAIALTLRAVGGLTTAEIAKRVPGAGGDDGPADQPGEAAHQGLRACRSGCPTREERAERLRVGAARAVPDLQRGVHQQHRRRPAPHRPVRRGDPADPDGAPACCPDDGEVAGLLALMLLTDARRPARTGAGRRADPAGRAGPDAVGPAADRRGRRADHAARCPRARSARTSCRPRSPPSTTRRPAPRTPTGRRSSPCTGCWSG